ncbi:MAG: 5-formyltetrahydrofolate cyclo-ligase [Candidatus Lokiarchaeota archaeon]|nr:5-formyltetrahydrofolate cyclo-ligase [Candidatus Lokiarchaeota archaeon]
MFHNSKKIVKGLMLTTEYKRDIYHKKLHYRKYLKRKRGSQSKSDVIEKSNKIFDKLINMPEYIDAKNLIVYCAKNNEVQTEKIIKHTLSRNKKVIVPITNTELRILEFSEILDYDKDLEISTFDILEPKKEAIRPFDLTRIDLIIIPGVGFDKYGGRIGYGYGYFDKFLNSIDKNSPFIGLAFELQIVEILPTTHHDARVDYIITEKRIIESKSEF